jgi:hypothetical protein
MPVLPKELHTTIVSPSFAAQVVVLPFIVADPGTSDAEPVVFIASRRSKVISAKYYQAADATADTTFTAQLLNGGTAISALLDIKTLGAATVASFVVKTNNDAVLAAGDVVSLDFDETGGTVTAPGQVLLAVELQILE